MIHFTKEEAHSEKEASEFRNWLFERINILGVLGDFAAKYVSENPDILTKQWEYLAKIIIIEFYKVAEKEPPDWLDYVIEQNPIVESSENTHFELRAFFMDIITNTYSRHIRSLTSNQDAILDISFYSRLNFCLDNKLISFLHQRTNRRDELEIAITADIFIELKKRKIENLTHLRDLSTELGFTYCQRKIGGINTKVACGKRDAFIAFLEGEITDDSDKDSNNNNNSDDHMQ